MDCTVVDTASAATSGTVERTYSEMAAVAVNRSSFAGSQGSASITRHEPTEEQDRRPGSRGLVSGHCDSADRWVPGSVGVMVRRTTDRLARP